MNANDNDVIVLREKLAAELQELDRKGFAIPENEVNDPIEAAKNHSDREMALSVFEKQAQKRIAILLAIDAIDKGSFKDHCNRCLKKIPLKRLLAVPWTEYCTDCQDLLEKLKAEYNGDTSSAKLDLHFV